MAYVNLVAQACADKNELFTRMRDFICKRNGTYDYSSEGIGWTLHDSSYATDEDNCAINDWYVIYSPGEGTKEDLYFKVTYISGYIKVEGYQSWDSTTHTGSTNKYNAANNLVLAEAGAKTFWVYGDLDYLMVFNYISTDLYHLVHFGKVVPAWDFQSGTIATCGTTLSAGSDVSIVLDSVPANWAVGKQVFIRTTHNDAMGTVKAEKITIKTLVSNTITADLTNSYTTGSRVSDFVGYMCQGHTNALTTVYFMLGDDGAINQGLSPVNINLTTSNFDPGSLEDKFYLIEVFYQAASDLGGKIAHLRKVPTFVAGLTHLDIMEEDDGTEWRCFRAYNSFYLGVKEV